MYRITMSKSTTPVYILFPPLGNKGNNKEKKKESGN